MTEAVSKLIPVAKASEFPSGTMREIVHQGRRILLARVGDDFFATQARCNHLGGPLPRGTLEGTVVTCPWHGSQYDLRDGRVLRWTDWSGAALAFTRLVRPPRPLVTYKVRRDGDNILVEL